MLDKYVAIASLSKRKLHDAQLLTLPANGINSIYNLGEKRVWLTPRQIQSHPSFRHP
jgi:hypothetical protein